MSDSDDRVTAMTERTKVEEWNTLQKHDEVTLTRERGCSYTFLGAVLDAEGNCLHVELVGGRIGKVTKKNGRTGQRMMRTVLPERVQIPSEKVLLKQRQLRQSRQEEG